VRTARCRVGRHDLRRRPLFHRGRTAVRARVRVGGSVWNRRHAGLTGQQRARRLSEGVPRRQRISGSRQRVEIATEPAGAGRRLRVRGAPDVGGLEVRAARMCIAGPLHASQPPLVEDVPEAAQPRMQPERPSAGVGSHLQHLPRGNRNRGTAAVIVRVLIRDQRVERVVAAAKVDDDEAARREALRLRDRAEERGRREPERDGGDAVTNEEPSRDAHVAASYTSWYSEEPTRSLASPAALVLSCASLPVQVPPATRYDISACCGIASNGAGVTRSSIAASSACGVRPSASSATASVSFWLAASVAAKFVRASIVPVENQPAPTGHPPTFGGSKSSWPMLASGERTLSSESPCQPTSLIARATYSVGHA